MKLYGTWSFSKEQSNVLKSNDTNKLLKEAAKLTGIVFWQIVGVIFFLGMVLLSLNINEYVPALIFVIIMVIFEFLYMRNLSFIQKCIERANSRGEL